MQSWGPGGGHVPACSAERRRIGESHRAAKGKFPRVLSSGVAGGSTIQFPRAARS